MPLMRRRPLMRAAMVGGAGYAVGQHRAKTAEHEQMQDQAIAQQQQAEAPPPQAPPPPAPAAAPAGPTSEADRIDALTKAKSLLDAGVLTEEQFESERQRLTQGL